jgi:aminoglycoside phosphotransferase (APT) family kinase protein
MTTATVWDWNVDARARLAQFLENARVTRGDVTTRMIGDGHSNLTFRVSDGDTSVVVRRPPPPPTPPGANDMLREARFLTALAGTGVPVPTVLATAQADEVIDVPFYVMSLVDGPIVTTATPATLSHPATRREIAESLVDTLALLHSVDVEAVGLSDAGRPEGFNARHLRRMSALVADTDGTLPEAFARVARWLGEHVPAESGAAIIHNDFRIGNVVLGADAPGRVAAVLDWELAALGDPLFDLGYFLATIPVADEPMTPTQELSTAMLEPGFPSRAELAERYAARTGADLTHLAWYSTLASWKLAALYEYGRRRAVTGSGDDYYLDPALVGSFLEAAHRTAGL